MEQLTVEQIRFQLQQADAAQLKVLERSLAADTRKGVRQAVRSAQRRIAAAQAEEARLASLYEEQAALMRSRGSQVALGLDEVGRGPVAGPVAVGGVVLAQDARIEGLNDSKQLPPEARERIAAQIKERAAAWTVQYASVEEIDAHGIGGALRLAFRRAIEAISAQGIACDLILLDGNPMHLDPREQNVVKGDSSVACIAAASIIAKVERDALMEELGRQYPGYAFAENKGYGTEAHREAIRELGLTPVHRTSFCNTFMQPTLF